MGDAQSDEQTLNIAHVKVTYNNETTRTFRIPLEEENRIDSPYATYSKIIEAMAASFDTGRDGFIQLAELDEAYETVIVFISLWNVNDIQISLTQEVI